MQLEKNMVITYEHTVVVCDDQILCYLRLSYNSYYRVFVKTIQCIDAYKIQLFNKNFKIGIF